MPEYWDRVRRFWSESADASSVSGKDRARGLRRQWLPFLPFPTEAIAITGLRGAGKTVLYDALAGRIGRGYKFGQSEDTESHRVKTVGRRRTRSHFSVVPGELVTAAEREDIIDELFRYDNAPRGVIHVVSWGHDWIWKESVRRSLLKERQNSGQQTSLEAIRDDNLKAELKDFAETCDLLCAAWSSVRPSESNIWLIIAVTKCDLYWDRLGEAQDYYIPGGTVKESDFCSTLRSSLVSPLTERRLRNLAVLPVSSLSVPYNLVPGSVIEPQLNDDGKRLALLNQMRKVIGEFNGK